MSVKSFIDTLKVDIGKRILDNVSVINSQTDRQKNEQRKTDKESM